MLKNESYDIVTCPKDSCTYCRPFSLFKRKLPSSNSFVEELSGSAEIQVGERNSVTSEDIHSYDHKFSQAFRDQSHLSRIETCGRSLPRVQKQNGLLENNYVRADPSYLKTLGQAHSGWIFGAIAELVDNARDAKATKLVDLIISYSIPFFKFFFYLKKL